MATRECFRVSGQLVTGKPVVDWVAVHLRTFGGYSAATGIGWARHGKIVAGVVYEDWNGASVVCHIASDGSRRWLTREFLWTIFDYPFQQLGAKRITVCVAENNADSTRFVKNLGFIMEARLEDAHPTGAILVFCMKRPDCRFIQMRTSRGKRNINASAA